MMNENENECAFFVLFCCFFFNFFEFISVNSLKMANIDELPYGVLGTAPKFGSAKKMNFSLCLRPPYNAAKGNFSRWCSERFYRKLIGLITVAVTVVFVVAPRIYHDLCKPLRIRRRLPSVH